MVLTWCFAEVIRSTAKVDSPSVAHFDKLISHNIEVTRDGKATRIDVLHRGSVSKPRYLNANAIIVARSASDVVVDQLHVVDPAINDEGHQELQIQPQTEILGTLVAEVMRHVRLFQTRLQLASTVTGNCQCNGTLDVIIFL